MPKAVIDKSAEAAAHVSKRSVRMHAAVTSKRTALSPDEASDPKLIAKAARAAAKRVRREGRENELLQAEATMTAASAESAVTAGSEKAATPPAEAMCNEPDAEVKAGFEENEAASGSMAEAKIAAPEVAVSPSAKAADPEVGAALAQLAAAAAGPAPATTPVGITPELKG